MILNLKIAKENAIIFDFEIKMYIVVIVCDTTFDDEIIDENDEIVSKLKRILKISLIEILINCIKIKFVMFAKIMKNNKLL